MRKKRIRTLREREALSGYAFIGIWIIGFIYFFARPLITSLVYALNKVRFTPNGVSLTWMGGLENFIYAFRDDVYFMNNTFVPGITSFLIEVPIIVIFSLFIAIILNQKFRGRVFARAMFFLPVIIASGLIINILKNNGLTTNLEQENVYVFNSGGISMVLTEIGLPDGIVNVFKEVSNKIFDIVWMSGIQIILYLGGLQSIPVSEYEAANIDGATAWETFWKITWPRISPQTLVIVVYSIIDSYTNLSNPMIQFIHSEFNMKGNIGGSAGMGWLYSMIVFIVLIIFVKLISKHVFYAND